MGASQPASFPVVLSKISMVTSRNEPGGKIRLSRLVPSLPQSLESALRPGDDAGNQQNFVGAVPLGPRHSERL